MLAYYVNFSASKTNHKLLRDLGLKFKEITNNKMPSLKQIRQLDIPEILGRMLAAATTIELKGNSPWDINADFDVRNYNALEYLYTIIPNLKDHLLDDYDSSDSYTFTSLLDKYLIPMARDLAMPDSIDAQLLGLTCPRKIKACIYAALYLKRINLNELFKHVLFGRYTKDILKRFYNLSDKTQFVDFSKDASTWSEFFSNEILENGESDLEYIGLKIHSKSLNTQVEKKIQIFINGEQSDLLYIVSQNRTSFSLACAHHCVELFPMIGVDKQVDSLRLDFFSVPIVDLYLERRYDLYKKLLKDIKSEYIKFQETIESGVHANHALNSAYDVIAGQYKKYQASFVQNINASHMEKVVDKVSLLLRSRIQNQFRSFGIEKEEYGQVTSAYRFLSWIVLFLSGLGAEKLIVMNKYTHALLNQPITEAEKQLTSLINNYLMQYYFGFDNKKSGALDDLCAFYQLIWRIKADVAFAKIEL